MLIVCPSCGIKYNVPESFLKKERVLKCASCGTSWVVPAVTAKEEPAPVSEPVAPPPPAAPEAAAPPPPAPEPEGHGEEPASEVSAEIPEAEETAAPSPAPEPAADHVHPGAPAAEAPEPPSQEEATPSPQPEESSGTQAAVTAEHHEEPVSELEKEEEEAPFTFLDEAIARASHQDETPLQAHSAVWDESELDARISESHWEDEHPEAEKESLASEPADLDSLTPEQLHERAHDAHHEDEVHAVHAEEHAPAEEDDSFDDVIARLRAARSGEPVPEEPRAAPQPAAEPAPEAAVAAEPEAPWVPAWERAHQAPEEAHPEEAPAHENFSVWSTEAEEEAPAAHEEQSVATEEHHEASPPAEDSGEVRHVMPSADIASQVRDDILRRKSGGDRSVPVWQREEFWKKAWVASGVCAVLGAGAVWHWFDTLCRVWPALKLL